MAAIREASYKKKIEQYYNARVQKVDFLPGDLVLRANEASNLSRPRKHIFPPANISADSLGLCS